MLATFEREPELIDVVALHLLDRHFAPGLHEEILEPVGLELGTPIATRRRDMAFRTAPGLRSTATFGQIAQARTAEPL